MSNLIRGAIAAAAFVASAPAFATVYSFEELDPSGSTAAGEFTSVSGLYDTESNFLSWSSSWDEKSGRLPEAFWMVLSDGPNAKGHDETYAVLYGSLAGDDAGDMAAYVYDGENGAGSWETRDFIASFDDVIAIDDSVAGSRSMTLEIDATGINGFGAANGLGDWFGTGFGERVGVWQHAFIGDLSFDDSGEITNLDVSRESWYDVGGRATTIVPPPAVVSEPAPLALIGLGMLLAGVSARRRSA